MTARTARSAIHRTWPGSWGRSLLTCVLLACLCAGCGEGRAWGPKRSIEIEGTVTDARTGKPVEGAWVLIGLGGSRAGFMSPHGSSGCMGGGPALLTDANGHYRFSAKLSDIAKKPYPSAWIAEISLYKRGWRDEPPTRFARYLASVQTDFTVAPITDESFEEWSERIGRFYDGLCEAGRKENGWKAFHRDVFDEVFERYCVGELKDRVDYTTFLAAYGALRREAIRDELWNHRSDGLTSDEYRSVEAAFEPRIQSLVPTFDWPYGGIWAEKATPRDFAPAEKVQTCQYLASLRPKT